jgi:transcriptional regulator with XRE-family HTH domain
VSVIERVIEKRLTQAEAARILGLTSRQVRRLRRAYRTPDGRIELAGWVRNFTDIRYKIDVFDVSRGDNTILEVWGDPRTYGLTLSYAW